ncbi:MAG TPA: type II toxin-antitoxin system VapB family antitoxin [Longimicrobiales bacterium]|nr:type II toxin-antitoxin system VapB family antitoxin [Longimicrobiales bacterium]
MAINIKNPEADRLVRELAELTGESITDAVVAAIRERLARQREQRGRQRTLQQITRIRERYRALPLEDDRSAEEILAYDERGLPGGG